MTVITVGASGTDHTTIADAIAAVPDPIDDYYEIQIYAGGAANIYGETIDVSAIADKTAANYIKFVAMVSHGGQHAESCYGIFVMIALVVLVSNCIQSI